MRVVVRENLPQEVSPFIVQMAHAEDDLEPVVKDKKSAQQRRFSQLQKILKYIAWVIIGKIDVMKVNEHAKALTSLKNGLQEKRYDSPKLI